MDLTDGGANSKGDVKSSGNHHDSSNCRRHDHQNYFRVLKIVLPLFVVLGLSYLVLNQSDYPSQLFLRNYMFSQGNLSSESCKTIQENTTTTSNDTTTNIPSNLIHTGQEMFLSHRNLTTVMVHAENKAYELCRKDSEEAIQLATAKALSVESKLVRVQKENISLDHTVRELRSQNAALEQSLVEKEKEIDIAKMESEATRKECSARQSRVEDLSQQLKERDAALQTLREEMEGLKRNCDLAWMNADDFADQTDGVLEALGETETFFASENERLQGEVERLQNEVKHLDSELVVVKEEANQARPRDRVSGAADFKSSRVFANLVARLACPLGIHFWNTCIGQASNVGGFKEDFDPEEHLDPGKDADSRRLMSLSTSNSTPLVMQT